MERRTFPNAGVIDKNSDVTLRLLGTNEACFNIRLLRHISHRRMHRHPELGLQVITLFFECQLRSPSEADIGP